MTPTDATARPGPVRPVVLFDGVCTLCHGLVRWIVARDPDGRIHFASLQSEAAARAIADAGGPSVAAMPDSLVVIDDAGLHVRSSAALRIAGHLGGRYGLLSAARIVPRPLRDAVYRWVARNRYRWFGRSEACLVPTPELASRFLDADEAPVVEGTLTPTRAEPEPAPEPGPPDLQPVDDLDALSRVLGASRALLYKHSTQCGISSYVLEEVLAFADAHRDWPVHVVQVIEQRALSNAVADRSGVRHQSPQAFVIHDGRVVWHGSHMTISADQLARAVADV